MRLQSPVTRDRAQPGDLPENVLCVRCGYLLAGLALADKCPECGTDAAASWPPHNLLRAHPLYIRQLRLEVRWILAIASLVAISLASAATATPFAQHQLTPGTKDTVLTILAAVAGGVFFVITPLEAVALPRLKKHPNPRLTPGTEERLNIALGMGITGLGFGLAFILPAALSVFTSLHFAFGFVLCAGIMAFGLLVQYAAAMAYLRLTLVRARHPLPSRRIEEAPLFVGVGCVLLLPVAVIARMPIEWIVTAVLWTFTLAASGVVLRCVRTLSVLPRVRVQPKPPKI